MACFVRPLEVVHFSIVQLASLEVGWNVLYRKDVCRRFKGAFAHPKQIERVCRCSQMAFRDFRETGPRGLYWVVDCHKGGFTGTPGLSPATPLIKFVNAFSSSLFLL